MKNNLESQIIVLGAGGHGKSIVSVLQASGYSTFGVLDDDPETWGKLILGIPVRGGLDKISEYSECGIVMGFGENKKRQEIASIYTDVNWTKVLSTAAYINPSAKIGPGTVVLPGAVVAAEVVLGAHVIASANITIGHDTIVEDFAHIAPGAQVAGAVKIGIGAMLGMNSVVYPEINIGKDVILGAGAVAISDIPDGSKAFGIPAKVKVRN